MDFEAGHSCHLQQLPFGAVGNSLLFLQVISVFSFPSRHFSFYRKPPRRGSLVLWNGIWPGASIMQCEYPLVWLILLMKRETNTMINARHSAWFIDRAIMCHCATR